MTKTSTKSDTLPNSASEIVKLIQANSIALQQRSPDDATISRFGDAAKPLEWARQGDVYLHYYGDKPGACWKKVNAPAGLQMAPGNNPGSRHILNHGNGVTFYEVNLTATPNPRDPKAKLGFEARLTGLAFETKDRVTLTHPEHDHIDLAPGVYIVTFQREASDAMQFRRVED